MYQSHSFFVSLSIKQYKLLFAYVLPVSLSFFLLQRIISFIPSLLYSPSFRIWVLLIYTPYFRVIKQCRAGLTPLSSLQIMHSFDKLSVVAIPMTLQHISRDISSNISFRYFYVCIQEKTLWLRQNKRPPDEHTRNIPTTLSIRRYYSTTRWIPPSSVPQWRIVCPLSPNKPPHSSVRTLHVLRCIPIHSPAIPTLSRCSTLASSHSSLINLTTL